jgi:hypothetical protein
MFILDFYTRKKENSQWGVEICFAVIAISMDGFLVKISGGTGIKSLQT